MTASRKTRLKTSLADDFRKLCFYTTLELLRPLPFFWALRWLRLLGLCKYYVALGARRRAIRWMNVSLPGTASVMTRRRLAREQVVNSLVKDFASDLMMLQDAAKYPSLIRVEGWQHVQQMLESGNGVILLTTHVGVPRLLRWYLRTLDYEVCYLLKMGLPKVEKHSFRARFGRWHRNRYHLDDDVLFGQEELSVQYLKKAYRQLQQNQLVNISGDGSSGDTRVPVRICGQELSFATGWLSLGIMSGAEILPCFTMLDSSKLFRLVIQSPLRCADGDQGAKQLDAMLSDYVSRIEEYIQQNPTNVFISQYLRRVESVGPQASGL
ncbi:MAG: hypothetical protein P1U77_22735 [Rubripirellula sp.]|nr:hypothetical protein [Planctomycetaceae bacterium]MDF1844264.1 hypothetical protein [Rubripirellula sp.]